MNNELLPIGSVILLKGATKELMINGYLPVDKETGEVYDYTVIKQKKIQILLKKK